MLILASVTAACAEAADGLWATIVKYGEFRVRHDPSLRKEWIDSLPFAVYLPMHVFGEEPALKLTRVDIGNEILFRHEHPIEPAGASGTLVVQILEEAVAPVDAAMPPEKGSLAWCLANAARSRCPALRTSGGRVIYRQPRYFGFQIGETLIHVYLAVITPERHSIPHPFTPDEVGSFVDSFHEVGRSVLYGIPIDYERFEVQR